MRPKSASLPILFAALFTFALSIGPSVRADTITVANLTANTMAGIYTYTVTLTSTAQVGAGNGFVIYDFPSVMLSGTTFAWSPTSATTLALAGDSSSTFSPSVSTSYNGVSATSDGGVSASAPSGPANALDNYLTDVLGGSDNPLVDNLTFVYSGNAITGSSLGILTGTVTVQTSVAGSGATTSSAKYVSLDNGGGLFNGNVITVAGGGSFGSSPVPLPATFAGGGMLITSLGLAGLAKKISAARQA